MKKLFTILAVAATLVSCAKEDVVREAEGEAIQFGNAFVDNATRVDQAADPSYSAKMINEFNVYGTINDVVVYPGTVVSRNGLAYGDTWSCPVDQYWVPGAVHKFVGIVDGNKAGVTTTNLTNGMPTTISYTADGATDLLCETIVKTGNTNGQANGTVAFTFKHLLSKAMFTVTNSSTSATKYIHKVSGIKITNAYNTATYNVESKAWSGQAKATDYTGQAFDDIIIVGADASEVCANERLLIPGLKEVVVEFELTLYYDADGDGVGDDNEFISSTSYTGENAKKATIDINPNMAYNFTLAVSVGELITFTANPVVDWDNDHDGKENTTGDDEDNQVNNPLQ